jgi:hypothetical protein
MTLNKNIHLLPTDSKSSRLYFNVNDKEFQICEIEKPSTILKPNRHIYITSDEEIREGDWFYCPTTDIVNQCESDYHSKKLIKPKRFKIILTTDQDLIKDGVQAIDDEFLEWFVKNQSCEEVEIGNQSIQSFDTGHFEDFYKIIIPKEEPFKHKVEAIPAEEILANRSNAYKFINFDKQETEELNPHIGPFLLRNGFAKHKIGNNVYYNSECTIRVLAKDYEIQFENELGEVSMYTGTWSIYHLVGLLTWNDLIDKNYKK